MDKIQVLVIEDDLADRLWLEYKLLQLGLNCSLSSVTDGEQAVDFLLRRRNFACVATPGLIFLDAHLPKLDGIEILRKVPNAKSLPICVVTSSEDQRKIFQQEFGILDVNYLIKPVESEILRASSYVQLYLAVA